MSDLLKSAVIVELVETLHQQGNWCGETHIQKAMYLLQEVFHIKMFDFILYKHGPFSFELREKLNDMLAENDLILIPQHPYGPSYKKGERPNRYKRVFDVISSRYKKRITFIADKLGSSGIYSLETVATALYFNSENSSRDIESIADNVIKVKPHIQKDDALKAAAKVKELINEATQNF